MIPLKRDKIIQELSAQEVKNYNGHNHLIKDILERSGEEAMAFLVKKGAITFTQEELEAELNYMVENSLITIGQWEQMIGLLHNASNGHERITNFLRRKRRIKII